MAYTLELGTDGIIYALFTGDFTEEQLANYIHDLDELVNQSSADEKVKSFMDTTGLKRVNPNLRRMTGDLIKDPRLGETAVLGNSRVVKVMIDFVLKASGRDHMKYFTDRQEALIWLQDNHS